MQIDIVLAQQAEIQTLKALNADLQARNAELEENLVFAKEKTAHFKEWCQRAIDAKKQVEVQ